MDMNSLMGSARISVTVLEEGFGAPLIRSNNGTVVRYQ